MTYFGFLLKFLILPIILLLALPQERSAEFSARNFWRAVLTHVFLALAYTTPWDNYLVATGVWYYNPLLVTGLTLGYVPIEEYTFFVLETIFAGLWWRRVFGWADRIGDAPTLSFKFNTISAAVLAVIWGVSTFQFFFGAPEFTYLSIILFWALPAIFPQILFGADILWHQRRLVFASALPLSLYLSIVDSLAIRASTWTIAREQSTGILLGGVLPLEEALFFFITVTLVVFGLTLWLAPESKVRFAGLKIKLRGKGL